VGGNPEWDLKGFAELPVDGQVRLLNTSPGYCPQVNIEFKEIDDYWASKGNGHLGAQIMDMIAEGQPGFVAVFGSLEQVLAAVPKVKADNRGHGNVKPVRRTQMDVANDLNTARAFTGDAWGGNVPIMFLSTNHYLSFGWMLSAAKRILTGPNFNSWLPRFPVGPVAYRMLCAIPYVGDAAAKALLVEYESIAALVNDCKFNPEAIAETRVGEKRLGRAKARKIVEAFGCEAPGAWA
jgi:hypothetical protein